MASVFISYRRSDVPAQAGRVADALRRHSSEPQVFHDTADIRPGDLWREQIDAALAQCDAMVVVIGPGWLAPAPGGLNARLFDADDVVAYELAAGLAAARARRVRIVPLRVSGAELPTKAQLPEALAPLLASNALEIRDDAFERDMRALEAGILPAARKRTLWWGGAAAAVLVAALTGWQMKGKPAAPAQAGSAAAGPAVAAAGVDLDVDLSFVPNKAMEQLGLPASSMQLVPEKPKRRGALKLDRKAGDAGVPQRFVHEKLALPRAGETFVGLLARSLDGAVQVTADTADVIQTQVCFDMTSAAPPADGKLRLACREGQRCVPEGSGGIAVPCGSAPVRTTALPVRGWRFGDLLPSAQAQTVGGAASGSASAPAAATRPAPGDWIVPALSALRARRGTAQAVAFSEVTLTLGLPANVPLADEVSYDIRVNGHRLWVNGLPAWTHAVPYKPGTPCRVAFGLENLDSAGRHAGREKVQVRVLLLRDKQPVFEDSVEVDFLALRDQAERSATSIKGQPVTWKAEYQPAPADRYQIILHGGGQADTLAARDKLQAARVPASAVSAAGATEPLPLAGVVRPPTDTNPAWGMVVAVPQASGQLRFSFDLATAKALCAWMSDDAQARRFKANGFAQPQNFRVREIETEVNDATTRKPLVPCAVFGKA
jgi:hypothetical protein